MDVSNVDSSAQQLYISVKNFQDLINILNVGDVVKGRVIESNSAGMYLIDFLGHELISKSSHNFSKGDIIFSKVMGMEDTLNLKLITDNAGAPLNVSSAFDAEIFLDKNSLQNTPLNMNIANAMSQQGVDLTKENFNLISEAALKTGLSSANEIKAMAFLEANQIPLKEEMIASLASYLGNKEGVGQNVADVLTLMGDNFSSTKDIHIKDMLDALKNQILSSDNLSEKDISDLLKNSGLMYENKIKNALLENADLLLKTQPEKIDAELLEMLKGGKSMVQHLVNSTNPDVARLAKDLSSMFSGEITQKDLPKVMTNLMELSTVSKDKSLGDYFNRMGEYLSSSGDDRTSNLFKELLNLRESFKDLLDSGVMDKTREILFSRDMKFFLFSGNVSALNKMNSMLEGFETKEAESFRKSLANVKDMFENFMTQNKDYSRNMTEQKSDFMRALNATDDLKGMLLKVNEYFSQHLKNNPSFFQENSFDKTMEALDKAIMTLQGEQILNTKANTDYAYYSWQLPIEQNADIKSGKIEMFFKKDKEGDGKQSKSGKDTYKVAFLLDMTALGPVKIIADVKDYTVNCQIMVSDEKVKKFFDESLSELRGDFEKLSYDIGNISCVLDQRITFEANKQVMEDVNLGSVRKINILV